MKHFLLFFEFSDTYVAQREQYRKSHLKRAWEANERGELILAGALLDPLDTGVILFKGETSDGAEAFAKDDPYVLNGLIKRWWIREWMTVVGDNPSQILRP